MKVDVSYVDLAADGAVAPSGVYAMTAGVSPASLARSLAGVAPVRLAGPDVHVRIGQRPDRRAVVVLEPPLRDDERGTVNQERQRERYRGLRCPIGDATLLGGGADARAIANVVGTAGGGDVLWEVGDRSERPPANAEGVLRGSREWYDALAGSRLAAATTTSVRGWPGATGSGRCGSSASTRGSRLGVHAWRRAGMIEHLVAREVGHRHREWDVLLAPDDESATYLRDAFRWAGEVLVAGSPRTDRLVIGRPGRRTPRAAWRSLGVPDGTTLVLHAPAARDARDVATAAGRTDLDVAALARQLGPDVHACCDAPMRRTGGRRPTSPVSSTSPGATSPSCCLPPTWRCSTTHRSGSTGS